jgi:Tol biopolymer transport system component
MKLKLCAILILGCFKLSAQDTPTLVLPQIVSSELPEFASTITPDGKTIFFNRTTADRRKMYMMQTTRRGKTWQAATFPSFTDTTFREIDPYITPDGKRVLYSSQRPIDGTKEKDYDIWVSERKGKIWQKPTPLSKNINSAEDEVFVSASRNGNLYFARFEGNKAKFFRSKWENGAYQAAEKLDIGTDTASIGNPLISPDESMLIFWSPHLGGLGSTDLFICYRQTDGSWSKPKGLPAPINSPFTEIAPAFSPNGKTFYWTSERPGIVQDFPKDKRRPGDIYQISTEILMRFKNL